MAELLFNEFFCTYPFHIFAYLPFHSTLGSPAERSSGFGHGGTALPDRFRALSQRRFPAVYVQYTAIPVFGIFLYSLVKANVGIITFSISSSSTI